MKEDVPGFSERHKCEDCPYYDVSGYDEYSAEIIYLFNVLSSQVRTDFGVPTSLDYNSIAFVFDIYYIPKEIRSFYFEWIVLLVYEAVIKPAAAKAKNIADKGKQK